MATSSNLGPPFAFGRLDKGERLRRDSQNVPVHFAIVVDIVKNGYGIFAQGHIGNVDLKIPFLANMHVDPLPFFPIHKVLSGVVNSYPYPTRFMAEVAYLEDQRASGLVLGKRRGSMEYSQGEKQIQVHVGMFSWK